MDRRLGSRTRSSPIWSRPSRVARRRHESVSSCDQLPWISDQSQTPRESDIEFCLVRGWVNSRPTAHDKNVIGNLLPPPVPALHRDRKPGPHDQKFRLRRVPADLMVAPSLGLISSKVLGGSAACSLSVRRPAQARPASIVPMDLAAKGQRGLRFCPLPGASVDASLGWSPSAQAR